MSFYRRRLPHWIPERSIVFVTWRLAGSVGTPLRLLDAQIAAVVADALQHGRAVRHFYHLHAWVIMPDHVHVPWEPRVDLASIMRWLKGRTGRVANRILGRTGLPFWQDESFDHWIRSTEELRDLIWLRGRESCQGWAGRDGSAVALVQCMADDKNRSSAPRLVFHLNP